MGKVKLDDKKPLHKRTIGTIQKYHGEFATYQAQYYRGIGTHLNNLKKARPDTSDVVGKFVATATKVNRMIGLDAKSHRPNYEPVKLVKIIQASLADLKEGLEKKQVW